MDFPVSVPGAGLVAGQFVDENPALGQAGSLIPAKWGNAVTHEILNVITAAGLVPAEAQTDQLLQAIRSLVPERSVFARASGTVSLPAGAFGVYALADGGAAATVTLPAVVDLPSDTELLVFANHANTFGVQVKAATGDAVQGPAALMGASTTAFMLPAGGDWVRLRSEKAQGRWVVVCAGAHAASESRAGVIGIATQAEVDAGTNDVRAITPKKLISGGFRPIGVGQQWNNMIASRAANSTYTNTTGRTIFVSIQSESGTSGVDREIQVTDDSGVWIDVSYTGGGNDRESATFPVSNGRSYRINGAAVIRAWAELR